MIKIWGVHMGGKVDAAPIDNSYVGIGWHKLGNLQAIASTREQLINQNLTPIKKEKYKILNLKFLRDFL